jgi:signal transduction histidine kinase
MNRRGDFYLRQPLVPDAMGRNFGNRPVFSKLLPLSDAGVYRNPSGVDGVDRLYAYQASESHPDMVVIVGTDVDYVLGSWRVAATATAAMWILLAVAVLGFTRALLHSWRRNLQAQVQAQQQAQHMQVLSQRILGAQEAERARIARELHDELGQLLTAIKINLQTGQRKHGTLPAADMQENVQIIDDALRHVRHLALALRPSMLDNLGLRSALQWLAKDQAQRADWVLTLELDAIDQRLHSDLETCFFRVAQEALTNVARHAKATQVRLRLQCSEGLLHLQVHDNGVGVDFGRLPPATAREGGLGLQGMRERAALVGGQLQVQGYPGQGCTVHLSCPLRYADAPL